MPQNPRRSVLCQPTVELKSHRRLDLEKQGKNRRHYPSRSVLCQVICHYLHFHASKCCCDGSEVWHAWSAADLRSSIAVCRLDCSFVAPLAPALVCSQPESLHYLLHRKSCYKLAAETSRLISNSQQDHIECMVSEGSCVCA